MNPVLIRPDGVLGAARSSINGSLPATRGQTGNSYVTFAVHSAGVSGFVMNPDSSHCRLGVDRVGRRGIERLLHRA